MKFLKFLLLSLIVISCAIQPSSDSQYHFDEDGQSVPAEKFLERWRNKENGLSRWDSKNDTARVMRLSQNLYEQYVLSYPAFNANLEKLTGRQFDDSTTFLLEYVYLDDLCNAQRTNSWSKKQIEERKEFLDPIKAETEINHKKLVFLHFYEEGITLANNPNAQEEYFFTDVNNFLRNSVFQSPTLCGSFALIKPNGQVLVRNGESRMDWIAKYLQEEVWAQFFPPKGKEQ